MMRTGTLQRATRETDIDLTLVLDGDGTYAGATGIGFFDHMLTALAKHGGLSLTLSCKGDLHVDGHHTVEDVGLCLGGALAAALGDGTGIARFGGADVPMDEALARAVIDLSGRPFLRLSLPPLPPMIGDFDGQLLEEFLRALVQSARMTLHIEAHGENGHHIIEAVFKALARALRSAAALDPREKGIPSTKGAL